MNICAECQYVGCSWERAFEPVEGWEAEEVTLSGHNGKDKKKVKIQSYDVKRCPLYIPPPTRRPKDLSDCYIDGYCVETGETKRWRNLRKCAEAGFNARYVSACLNGTRAEYKGWLFAPGRS